MCRKNVLSGARASGLAVGDFNRFPLSSLWAPPIPVDGAVDREVALSAEASTDSTVAAGSFTHEVLPTDGPFMAVKQSKQGNVVMSNG